MDYVWKARAYFRIKWHLLKERVLGNEPESDCFRLVDVFLMIGGILYAPKTVWQRIMWNFYRFYTHLVFMVLLTNAVENAINESNVMAPIWCAIAITVLVTSILNESIIRKSAPIIQNVRHYINSKCSTMVDLDFDSVTRRKFYRTSKLVSLGMLALIVFDEMLSPLILIVREDRIFGLPKMLRFSNSVVKEVIHFVYLISVIPIWAIKVFIPLVLVTVLIAGAQSKLKVFNKEFQIFCDRARRLAHLGVVNWEDLMAEANALFERHVSYLQIQLQLENMLSKLFLVTYCGDVINIGPMIFTLLKEGLSPSSTVLVLSIMSFFAQCYRWCRLAEYFQENVEIEQHLTDLVMDMPYVKKHQSCYCQLRTSLMILKMCTQKINSVKMVNGCTINVEVFTRLLNISYSALNFLINIDS